MKTYSVITYCILLLLAANNIFAQNITACIDTSFDNDYVNNNGTIFNTFVTTKDGGILLGTYAYSTTQFNQTELTKLDAAGNVTWSRGLKVADPTTVIDIQNLLSLKNEGYIISCLLQGTAINSNNNSFVLIKFDEGGNILWQHIYTLTDTNTSESGGTIQGLSEGADNEIIANFAYKHIVNGEIVKGIIHFDNNGNIIWSNSFYGQKNIFTRNEVSYNNNHINIWLEGNSAAPNCFINNSTNTASVSIGNMTLDYATGNAIKYQGFCNAPANQQLNVNNNLLRFSKRFSNGNTVLIMPSNNNLLISLFDSDFNFVKSKLYIPPLVPGYGQNVYYNFSSNYNGDIAINVSMQSNTGFPQTPYTPFIILDTGLNIKQEFILRSPHMDYSASGGFSTQLTQINFFIQVLIIPTIHIR